MRCVSLDGWLVGGDLDRQLGVQRLALILILELDPPHTVRIACIKHRVGCIGWNWIGVE